MRIHVGDDVRWTDSPRERGHVVRVTRDGRNALVETRSVGTRTRVWVRIRDLEIEPDGDLPSTFGDDAETAFRDDTNKESEANGDR